MIPDYVIIISLLSLIPEVHGLNALFISINRAGHVIPMFELAKAMNNDNITFLTLKSADDYINFNSHSLPSTFHIIYANDSPDALVIERKMEQEIHTLLSYQSIFDAIPQLLSLTGQYITNVLNKSVEVLMTQRFDVIIAGTMGLGRTLWPLLCERATTPCVLQTPAPLFDFLDWNSPNAFSLATAKDLSTTKYRLYHFIYTMRLMAHLIINLPIFSKFYQSLPQIPGPFHDCFTLKNILTSKPKHLELISMPPTFFTPTYSHHYKKYMGAFVDDTQIDNTNSELARWVKSKDARSIVYATFGSSSVIPFHRMFSLINGIAAFLLKTSGSFALLVFRSDNYHTYQTVLKELTNEEFKRVLNTNNRVRIEHGFVQQKWLLSQKSVKLFLTHCGMSSTLEGLYFQKPVLCMPYSTDQFGNAIAIDNLGVGLSLFVSNLSPLQSLISPLCFNNYTFTAESVEDKLTILWTNEKYEQAARMMSLEMKHAGGVKRAVEEIRFFVNLNGNLDRYAPFQSTLPFYQRYMLDILFILIILPIATAVYFIKKCCQKQRKEKID